MWIHNIGRSEIIGANRFKVKVRGVNALQGRGHRIEVVGGVTEGTSPHDPRLWL